MNQINVNHDTIAVWNLARKQIFIPMKVSFFWKWIWQTGLIIEMKIQINLKDLERMGVFITSHIKAFLAIIYIWPKCLGNFYQKCLWENINETKGERINVVNKVEVNVVNIVNIESLPLLHSWCRTKQTQLCFLRIKTAVFLLDTDSFNFIILKRLRHTSFKLNIVNFSRVLPPGSPMNLLRG